MNIVAKIKTEIRLTPEEKSVLEEANALLFRMFMAAPSGSQLEKLLSDADDMLKNIRDVISDGVYEEVLEVAEDV